MNNKSSIPNSNHKLQKTISNLVSNVISSLCQQMVQYEQSIDIFGLLNINVDKDVDIIVKVNEKFVKKDSTIVSNSGKGLGISQLIDAVQNSKKSTNTDEIDDSHYKDGGGYAGDVNENKENTYTESNGELHKRRPRKPNQTFKHINVDTFDDNDEDNKCTSGSEFEEKSLKIDTQFNVRNCNSEPLERIDKMDCTNTQDENNSASGETLKTTVIDVEVNVDKDEDEREIVEKIRANFPVTSSIAPVASSTIKPGNFKCTICDRQFKRKFCLTRHKRIHQNYKSYSCNICGLGFDLVNQLKRHLRSSHACNRENLRRSCRPDQKQPEVKRAGDSTALCSTMDCSWPQTSKPIITSLSSELSSIISKANVYNSLSSNTVTNKRPFPTAFPSTMTTPISNSTNFQVRQMFNSIMMAAEASGSVYSNPMYFMQPYSTILPAYCQAQTTVNTSTTSQSVNSVPLTTTPLYRFPPSLFTSPTMKSVPLSAVVAGGTTKPLHTRSTPTATDPSKSSSTNSAAISTTTVSMATNNCSGPTIALATTTAPTTRPLTTIKTE